MSEKIEKMAMKTIIKDKLNPTIDRILEEPTTEYLPNVSLQPKYDFQIFQTHSKRKGKRTLSKLLYDLQETDPRYTKIDSDSDNPEPRKYVEIMDVDEFSPNEENEATVEALKTLNFDIDPKFKKVLKLHQVEGLQFMWDRVYVAKEGCLLAHSMGLGKSIQTIALLSTMYQHLKRDPSSNFPTGKRVLLLAPLVTLANWVNEFHKWSVDNLESIIGDVYNISGIKANTNDRLSYLRYWYNNGGVMIMSYDFYRNILGNQKLTDQAKDECYKMLTDPGPDIVILDEGHRIKNINSSITNLIYQIQTKSRICLTGYPLQNNLMEYFYMINFVAPNLLGSREQFKASFKTVIEKCYADSTESRKLQAAVKLYVLQLLTSSVTHRRDGSILAAELPVKREYIVRFKMSHAQFEGYMNLVKYADESESPLIGLILLRALCNHPKVLEMLLKRRFDKNRNKALNKEYAHEKDHFYIDDREIDQEILNIPDSDSMDEAEEELLEKFSVAAYDHMKAYFERPDIESWKCSGKMSFIADLAQNCIVMNEKLVVVSHSIACLDYIEGLLPIFGIKSLKINGSTLGLQRQDIIDKFQKDRSYGVILLSAKAAAIGINLTAANRIVLMDQDWNPLYDEQSIGRVYRYGQTKPVHVYRLVTASTIEERILTQSLHKKSIFKRVIDNKVAGGISKEELTEYYALPSSDINLINIHELDDSIKKDLINASVVRENKSCISSCRPYQEEEEGDISAWVNELSEHDRSTAVQEAKKLYKNWKRSFLK